MKLSDLNWVTFDAPIEYYIETRWLTFGIEKPDLSQEILDTFHISKKEADDNYFNKYRTTTSAEGWRQLIQSINKFELEHPTTIKYQNDLSAAKQEAVVKSFCGKGLDKVGTILEFEDGSIYLIGDMNTGDEQGGCGCCGFSEGRKVKRYAVLIDMEEKK